MEAINSGFLYKPFVPHPAWLFILAVLSAVVFGFIGLRSRRSAVLWAISGAIFTLFSSTIVSGLADATALPYTDAVRNSRQTLALILSVVIVALIAALLFVAGSGLVGRWWAGRIRNRPAGAV